MSNYVGVATMLSFSIVAVLSSGGAIGSAQTALLFFIYNIEASEVSPTLA